MRTRRICGFLVLIGIVCFGFFSKPSDAGIWTFAAVATPTPTATPSPIAQAYERQAPAVADGNAGETSVAPGPLATAPTSGDLLLVEAVGSVNGSTTPSGSGWTRLFYDTSGNPNQALWYKTAGASEPTSVTLTLSGNTNMTSAAIYVDLANASTSAPGYNTAQLSWNHTSKTASTAQYTSVPAGAYVMAQFNFNGYSNGYVPGSALFGDNTSSTFLDSPLSGSLLTNKSTSSTGTSSSVNWGRGTYLSAQSSINVTLFDGSVTDLNFNKGATPHTMASMVVVSPGASLVAVSASPTPVPVAAAQADAIPAMQGINMHLNYTGTNSYVSWYSTPAPNGYTIKTALQTLGMRHVRQGGIDTNSTVITCAQFLALQSYGIVDTIEGTGTGDTGSTWQREYNCVGYPFLFGFEGPNEYNSPGGGTYNNGSNWYVADYNAQQALANGRGTYYSSSVALIAAPLIIQTNVQDLVSLQGYNTTTPFSTYTQYGNIHSYATNNPDSYGIGPLLTWTSSSGASQSGQGGAFATQLSPNGFADIDSTGPTFLTEYGFSDTSLAYTQVGESYLTPDAKTKYMLRSVLVGYAAGAARMYVYQLARQSHSDDYYGLMDQYLNPTPTYYGIANMNAILNDPGSAFTPGSLSYAITSKQSDIRTQLYQKRDGSYWLAYWKADNGFDAGTATGETSSYDISVPTSSTSLQLGANPGYLRNFAINPTTGAVTVTTPTVSQSVAITVTDTPQVMEIGTSSLPALITPVSPTCPAGDSQVLYCANGSPDAL